MADIIVNAQDRVKDFYNGEMDKKYLQIGIVNNLGYLCIAITMAVTFLDCL